MCAVCARVPNSILPSPRRPCSDALDVAILSVPLARGTQVPLCGVSDTLLLFVRLSLELWMRLVVGRCALRRASFATRGGLCGRIPPLSRAFCSISTPAGNDEEQRSREAALRAVNARLETEAKSSRRWRLAILGVGAVVGVYTVSYLVVMQNQLQVEYAELRAITSPYKPLPPGTVKVLANGDLQQLDGSVVARVPEPGFMPAESFVGSRPGYVFKAGLDGVGYYPDYHPSVRADFKQRQR